MTATIESTNQELKSLTERLAPDSIDEALTARWKTACSHLRALGPTEEIVTRQYDYEYEPRYFEGERESRHERDTYPEKGVRLFQVTDLDYHGAGTSWQVNLLTTGNLLSLQCRTRVDHTAGWSLGRNEDLFDFVAEVREIDNHGHEGLSFIASEVDTLRQKARVAAYQCWELRARSSLKGDQLSDWLRGKMLAGIPDDLWL
jgi:hypothetical protein